MQPSSNEPIFGPMKAISLWQPWASLKACNAKIYETRSWATSYRGPIAIAATKYMPSPDDLVLAVGVSTLKSMCDALREFGIGGMGFSG